RHQVGRLAHRYGPGGRRSRGQGYRHGNSRAGGAKHAVAYGALPRKGTPCKRAGKTPAQRCIQTCRAIGYNRHGSNSFSVRAMTLRRSRSMLLCRVPFLIFFSLLTPASLVRLLGGAESFAAAQSASGPPRSSQSKSTKVANPLNDLLNDAQHAIDSNHFEAAIPPLQKFIEEKPDVAYAHFQLAYAYTALHRLDEAKTEYERATAIDPKMSEAYLNLGLLLTEKEPAAAVAPLRKAVELLPAQSRPRLLL